MYDDTDLNDNKKYISDCEKFNSEKMKKLW